MNTYLITRTTAGGTTIRERVETRTPQAAARKVLGRGVSFGAERDTMAGAVRALEVSTPSSAGQVEWANQPNIRLARYVSRPEDAGFFTDPSAWTDGEKHPLTVLG